MKKIQNKGFFIFRLNYICMYNALLFEKMNNFLENKYNRVSEHLPRIIDS